MNGIGVVAHTTRAHEAKQLAHTVKADFASFDNGILGCETNHHTVQHHLSKLPTTWSVILEDDAQPINDFTEQLDAALPLAPTPIVSLYLGRKRPPHWQRRIEKALRQTHEQNAHWIISTHLLHAVGYAIKTELLPSLLNHTTTLPADEHITSWAQRYGHCISYTVGSLVDHADLPTIVQHPDGQPRRPGRKAWTLGGHQRWNTQTVPLR